MKIRYDDVIIVVHENNIWFLYTLYIGMGATNEGAFKQFYSFFSLCESIIEQKDQPDSLGVSASC
jgi:hypothetical protein